MSYSFEKFKDLFLCCFKINGYDCVCKRQSDSGLGFTLEFARARDLDKFLKQHSPEVALTYRNCKFFNIWLC